LERLLECMEGLHIVGILAKLFEGGFRRPLSRTD
jgi:hypothetical protein